MANDSIDLTVEPGEIHALLGENGAGKTTLMNVLFGLMHPDSGDILLDGKVVTSTIPAPPSAAGIGMVHQHFMLVPVFTVAENVMLGFEPNDRPRSARPAPGPQADIRRLSRRSASTSTRTRWWRTSRSASSSASRSSRRSSVRRASHLGRADRRAHPGRDRGAVPHHAVLEASGKSIIFITHKLKEVQEIADRITVIRRGKVVGSPPPTATDEELASLMVGRPVELKVHKDPAQPDGVILEIEGLRVEDATGRAVVDRSRSRSRGGEIVGIAGVQGNGQTELCEAILGLEHARRARSAWRGRDLTNART